MKNPRSQTRRTRGLSASLLSALILLCVCGFAALAARSQPEPRHEQLLNGLRVLLVSRPGDANVIIKLRVHDGAAFDLAGKEGLMATLADAMFDQQTRDYVREELGGRLDVSIDYDSINITLAGKASDFDRLIELARNAVVNTQLTPEAVERIRTARVKALRDSATTPAEIADRAVAARLFGTHPYGRVVEGSPESVARIERADLMLMRERFLNADNTTLIIVGGVDAGRVMRTLRESFGGWRKSDRAVPSTFRLPEPPDARTLVINQTGSSDVELRLAVRGLARTDRDAPAGQLLTSLVLQRWMAAMPELAGRNAEVRHLSYHDGGIFIIGARLRSAAEAAKALEAAHAVLNGLSTNPVPASELENSKGVVASGYNLATQDVNRAADSWLDEHTYGPAATMPEMGRAVSALTPDEVERVAARLFLHAPVATVAVGDATQLRTELARVGAVEVFGEAAQKPPPEPPPPANQAKPKQPAIQFKRP